MPPDELVQRSNSRGKQHHDASLPPTPQKCGIGVLSQLPAELQEPHQWRTGPDGAVTTANDCMMGE